MTKEVERRYMGDVEVRAAGENEPPVISGYAAVFNELSEDLGGFREKIAPGAFAKTLGADVRALFNHDSNLVLGRTKSGTLKLAEDSRGLRVEFTPPDTATARHIVEAMKRGDVDQMSFGFVTRADKWEKDEEGPVRTLLDVELFDVSVVTYPAYPQTAAAVRSMEQWRHDQEPEPVPLPDYDAMRRKLELIGA